MHISNYFRGQFFAGKSSGRCCSMYALDLSRGLFGVSIRPLRGAKPAPLGLLDGHGFAYRGACFESFCCLPIFLSAGCYTSAVL